MEEEEADEDCGERCFWKKSARTDAVSSVTASSTVSGFASCSLSCSRVCFICTADGARAVNTPKSGPWVSVRRGFVCARKKSEGATHWMAKKSWWRREAGTRAPLRRSILRAAESFRRLESEESESREEEGEEVDKERWRAASE